MPLSRRTLLGSAAALGTAPVLRARAQSRPVIKLGVLTDLGGTYRDNTGPTSVAAAQLAIDEMRPHINFDVELISADHQNKPDIAASIARQWFDQGIDAAIDVPTSSVALAVAQVAKEKDKMMLNASATVAALTWEQCSPNSIVWSFDTYENAHSTGGALMAAGNKSWFFITANYAFGQSLAELTKDVVKKGGGEVKGDLRYPFPDTTDFSSYPDPGAGERCEGPGPRECRIGHAELHQAGGGIRPEQENEDRTAAAVHHRRAYARARGVRRTDHHRDVLLGSRRPNPGLHEAAVDEVTEQLSEPGACERLCHHVALPEDGTADGWCGGEEERPGDVAKMKSIPTDDDAFGPGRVRADGRGEFPAYLFQVKTKAESKGPWDLYKLVHTSPPSEVLHPLADTCKFPTA